MKALTGSLWQDLILHFLLLSVAVNTLWLQTELQGNALYLAKVLTVALPLVCLNMALAQLQGWEAITAGMASVSLAPLVVMPVILNTSKENPDKFQLRLSSLCTTGALLSTIINLAML